MQRLYSRLQEAVPVSAGHYVLWLHERILRCSSVTVIELSMTKSLWVDAVSDSSWINVESTRNSEQVCEY